MQFSIQKTTNEKSITSIVLRAVCMALICISSQTSWAEIRLSKSWQLDDKTHNLPRPAFSETDMFDAAVEKTASEFNAVPKSKAFAYAEAKYDEGFKLYIDKNLYYVNSVLFAPKRFAGDVCTPNEKSFDCVEGQRRLQKAHLFFFNNYFENVGVHQLNISEPNEYFVNASLSMGVYNKDRNELLISLEYFPIDKKNDTKFSTPAKRITLLVRLKIENGKILVEQDDRCLKNPNMIKTIPEARKILKRCQDNPH